MRKFRWITCFVLVCACTSAACYGMDYSNRKYGNTVDTLNPASHQILDADCVFDSGKFIMKSLPANLPSLFTLRFTAPADFTQGNTIVINGTEMPLRVPSMINASSAIFRAGAVFHIDIDMDRQVAFAWGNQGGSGAGSLPDMSYDEQFAGFYDFDGNKVYVKTVEIPNFAGDTFNRVPHNISNFKNLIRMDPVWNSGQAFGQGNYCVYTTTLFYFVVDEENVTVRTVSSSWSTYSAKVTIFYTCTDR